MVGFSLAHIVAAFHFACKKRIEQSTTKGLDYLLFWRKDFAVFATRAKQGLLQSYKLGIKCLFIERKVYKFVCFACWRTDHKHRINTSSSSTDFQVEVKIAHLFLQSL